MESTNSVWREIRELPPLQLLNGIYQWYTTTWYKRRQVRLVSGNLILSNAAYQAYKHRESAAQSFQVLPSSEIDFLVTTPHGTEFIVAIPPIALVASEQLQGHCSCRKYEDFNAPCSHAIACLLYLNRDPFSLFPCYYKWDILQRTYKYPIQPVIIQGLNAIVHNTYGSVLGPPIKKAKRGRPKVSRIRANRSSETRIYNCSVCSQPGHNRRVCPNQPTEHGRAQRARDQLVEGEYKRLLI